jgi:hypothetical protein
MPLPPPNGKPDPDAIYYDHPATDNLSTRTKTNVSIFDNPSAQRSSPQTRAIDVEYKSYLVNKTGPLWETSWTYRTTATFDGQGMRVGTVGGIKGRSTNTFAPPLNGAKWNIGKRVDANGRPIGETEQATNPFFKP